MKKIILYVLLLGVVLMKPHRGEDVGKLLPVEVIKMYKIGETLVIDTDPGATGKGATVDEAVANLKNTAAGVIFLDTADYLLIDETSKDAVPALELYLKPAVRVCEVEGEVDLKKTSEFLSVHRPSAKLKDKQGGMASEILMMEDGRLILKEN